MRFAGIDGGRARRRRCSRRSRRPTAIVICPSNPLVSVGPILAVPGMREAIAAARARGVPVAAVSPIIGGRALKGPADRMLVVAGPRGVGAGRRAAVRGPRATCSCWTRSMRALAPAVEALGMRAARHRHDHDRRRVAAPASRARCSRPLRTAGSLTRWACATRSASSRTSSRACSSGRREIEAHRPRRATRHVEHVVIAARGTSDHAAIYAQYLFGHPACGCRSRCAGAVDRVAVPRGARVRAVARDRRSASRAHRPTSSGVVDAARAPGRRRRSRSPTSRRSALGGRSGARDRPRRRARSGRSPRPRPTPPTLDGDRRCWSAALGEDPTLGARPVDRPAGARSRRRSARGRRRAERRRRPTPACAPAPCSGAASSTRRPASGRSSSRSSPRSSPTPTRPPTSATARSPWSSAATRCSPSRPRARSPRT